MNFEIEGKSLIQAKRRNSTRQTIFQSKIFNSQIKKKQSNYFGLQNSEDTKKLIRDLKKLLEQQKKKRQHAQEQLKKWKQKTVIKQLQFRNIICKYQKEKIMLDSNQLFNQHNKILKMIDQKDEAAQKWLEKKYKENLIIMENRIYQIKKKCEQQISKHQKLSLETYNQIMNEVQYAKNIAKNIDQENKKLDHQIKQIRLKYQLLYEERNILVRQIIDKNNSIKKNNYCKAESRQITERLNTAKYGAQTNVRSSLKQTQSFILDQSPSPQKNEIKLVDLLKRTISREKKKNFELSKLFTKNSLKNRQLNDILWECIQQTRKDLKSNDNKVFHQALLQKVLKSEKLLKGIYQIQRNPLQQNEGQINYQQQIFQFLNKSKDIGFSAYTTQQL